MITTKNDSISIPIRIAKNNALSYAAVGLYVYIKSFAGNEEIRFDPDMSHEATEWLEELVSEGLLTNLGNGAYRL